MSQGLVVEAAPLTGSNLAGRYRLLQTIGEGGMGRIYRAEQIATGQVIANILSNAVKFTPDEGRITIRASRRRSSITISVSDTGVGIAPGFLPHVFDRFRQGEGGTTRSHGGLGIGLSLARKLIELHGGTIDARSDGYGMGATFVIRLPIRDIPAIALTAYSGPDDAARARAAGFQVHLAKPIEPEQLVAAIASLTSSGPRRAIG
jgi:serine/threonine protein kinase